MENLEPRESKSPRTHASAAPPFGIVHCSHAFGEADYPQLGAYFCNCSISQSDAAPSVADVQEFVSGMYNDLDRTPERIAP